MGLELSRDSQLMLVAFGVYLVGVTAFGLLSHRLATKTTFVKDYFVGGRGLGAWVLALSIAGTAVSGGTFMGFPAFIYTNGWVMAFWICSYMVVPLTALALMGKRLNQVARVSGAVTVPDVFRDRFNSPALGLLATGILLVLLTFNLVAQFKGGANVMKEALRLRPAPALVADVRRPDPGTAVVEFATGFGLESVRVPLPVKEPEAFRWDVDREERQVFLICTTPAGEVAKRVPYPAARVTIPLLGWRVEKGYLIGLVLFSITVVTYTAYGGYWAVTWTDVFEGVVKLAGVIFLAVLAVRAVPDDPVTGHTGLAAATDSLLRQDPHLVYGPGPAEFLPMGLAVSFFVMWSVTTPGQAGGMVRLMSFRDTQSLRKAMVLIAFYYLLTYLLLIVIFVCRGPSSRRNTCGSRAPRGSRTRSCRPWCGRSRRRRSWRACSWPPLTRPSCPRWRRSCS